MKKGTKYDDFLAILPGLEDSSIVLKSISVTDERTINVNRDGMLGKSKIVKDCGSITVIDVAESTVTTEQLGKLIEDMKLAGDGLSGVETVLVKAFKALASEIVTSANSTARKAAEEAVSPAEALSDLLDDGKLSEAQFLATTAVLQDN